MQVSIAYDSLDLKHVTERRDMGPETVLVFLHTDYYDFFVLPTHHEQRNISFTFQRAGPNAANGGGGFQFLLMAATYSGDNQVGVKLEGTSRTVHITSKTIIMDTVMIYCPGLREYYPEVSPIKAVFTNMHIKVSGAVHAFVLTGTLEAMEDRIILHNQADQTHVKNFLGNSMLSFFEFQCIPWEPKTKAHIRMMYPITVSNVGIYNAYLHYMMNPETPFLGPERVHYLFDAALARNPEIPSQEMWQVILDVRFANPSQSKLTVDECMDSIKDTHEAKVVQEFRELLDTYDNDFRFLFIKAICVASDLLCVYNNAVPYLMDKERVSVAEFNSSVVHLQPFRERIKIRETQRKKNNSKGKHRIYVPGYSPARPPSRTYSANNVDVERFYNPLIAHGHDCEDGSTFGAYLKCIIQREAAVTQETRGAAPLSLIEYLGKVYELFNACVMGIYCENSNSPVFHIGLFLVPRWYMYQTKLRGYKHFGHMYNGVAPKKMANVPEWEKNPTYYGSFISEGTCIEEPCKFDTGRMGKQQRDTYTAYYRMVVNSINSGGEPKGMVNRMMLERKEYYQGKDGEFNSFYIVANTCDHIDADSFVPKSNGLYAEGGSDTFVWFDTNKARQNGFHENKWHSRTRAFSTASGDSRETFGVCGVPCADLCQRIDTVGCYPLHVMGSSAGKRAFDVSIDQMRSNWPPMAQYPISNSAPSPHIVAFITKLEADPLISKIIAWEVEKRKKCKFTRIHVPDTDLQDPVFAQAAFNSIAVLCKTANSLDVRVNYIQDAHFYPRTHGKEDTIVRTPLFQIVCIVYWK